MNKVDSLSKYKILKKKTKIKIHKTIQTKLNL